MKIYIDTSSLIKLYHDEEGTDVLDKIFEENTIQAVILSELAKVEFESALWKKVRAKELMELEAQKIIEYFHWDYQKYYFVPINSELILFASKFVSKYGTLGLRTLDAIQLASIVLVKPEISFAISADNLLKKFIRNEGINTK